ncbi:MAG: C4-dicarboxylate ABC transporter substrate-binding protein [Deltaproteobacteria bacterium RBG_16_49_23]|nr:MAG: C4-dicarboxylate ABC transporter substrate-binding protein [Deltaproteobacteria bacterium RBG_16_49_23]
MRRTFTIAMLALFVLTMTWAGSGICQDKPISLKLGHAVAVEHPYHLGAVKFAELVAQRTKNKVKIDVYPSTQLGNERDMVEGLQLGTIDLVVTSTGPLGGFVPKMFVVDLPFLFRDREHAYKVLDGPNGKDLLDAFSGKGIKGLAFWENGFRQITNNVRPIEKPEDLKGIKIRTMENKVHLASFKAFGASPAPMAWSEVYTALQQKTIDAQENPIAIIYHQKIAEVQKYLTLTGHFYSPTPLLISLKAFNGLPKDFQKIFEETAIECATYERNLLRDSEAKQIAELKAKGMQVTTPNKKLFQEAAASVYKEFEAQFGKETIDKIIATR